MLDARFVKQTLLFGTALLSVQGTAYILQLFAAAQMDAADYSRVRIIESLIAIGALIATFGLPSIVLLKLGTARTLDDRRRQVGASFVIVGVLAFIGACGFAVAVNFGFLQPEISGYNYLVVALAALVAVRLLLVAIAQARLHFLQLAAISGVSSGLSVAGFGLVNLVVAKPMTAWLVARMTLEVCVCSGLLVNALRGSAQDRKREMREKSDRTFAAVTKSLAAMALPTGASLVVRSVIEQGPILWLAAVGASATIVAQVGIVLTVGTIALVPSGIIQGALVPRLAHDLNHGGGKIDKNIGLLVLSAACVTAGVFAGLMPLTSTFLEWGQVATIGVVTAGSGMVIAKLAANAMGGYLLLAGRRGTILALNVATLSLAILAASAFHLWIDTTVGLLGVVWAIFAIEALAAISYAIWTIRTLRSAHTRSNADLRFDQPMPLQ